jgi:hypothetical protein
MAQDCVWAACQNSRHPASVLAQQTVPDRVDAAVYLAQALELQSVIDGVSANAKL